ncbi:hypothetical protein HMPREF1866_02179 [Lachnoanaerobaculum saburreum]|uniref:Uncharacterized protein n=1 Tax=Lachnoanaerobaculum saburreum TaxID=467210 RepID=A0A133ZIW5_9FIRM|nr:hypothetical protein HMPREF1866_02179 [Lachnoanaerobaculum saburreum]
MQIHFKTPASSLLLSIFSYMFYKDFIQIYHNRSFTYKSK